MGEGVLEAEAQEGRRSPSRPARGGVFCSLPDHDAMTRGLTPTP